MTDVTVMDGRTGRNILGQLVQAPRPSQVAKNLVASLLHPDARKATPGVVDDVLGLLSFLQFVENTRRKVAFAWNGLNQLVDEMSRNLSAFDLQQVKDIQMAKDALSELAEAINRFQTDTIQVPRAAPGESQFPYQGLDFFTFGLVKATWPTTFMFIQDELKKQIPEKLGIRLVLERWKSPAPTMSSAQEFVADEYSPSSGVVSETVVISEASRTSIHEDAEQLKEMSAKVEEAFKSIGASMGQAQVVVRGATIAVPWLVQKLGTWIGVQGVKKAATVGLVRYLFGKVTVKGIASAVWWTSIIGVTVVAAASAIPKIPKIVGDSADAANRALGAAKESIAPLVIIAAIAAGVALIGGAIALVTSR